MRVQAPSREGALPRLLLYSFPFAPQIGGLEHLTERTAQALLARGHSVTVVTDHRQQVAGGDEPAFSFQVLRAPEARRLWCAVRAADVVQMNGFDIQVFALARLARRPLVWQHIDYDTIDPKGVCSTYGRSCTFSPRRCWSCLRMGGSRRAAAGALAAFFAKAVASRMVDINVVASQYACERLRLPRMVRLPLGVDLDRFSPGRPRATGGDVFRLLFNARHIPAKGCDVLLRAVAHCAARGVQVRATIAGDGPHRRLSERLAESLGIAGRVEFKGFLPESDLVDLIRCVDAVVVPSTHDEYYGLAAAEAMACGTPVLASDAGGLPEVTGTGGLLFPPGNAEALADLAVRLARDGDARRRLGAEARAHALRSLAEDAMIDGYVEIYERLSHRRRVSGSVPPSPSSEKTHTLNASPPWRTDTSAGNGQVAGARHIACPVCDAEAASPLLEFDELTLRSRSRSDWRIVRCGGCGMVYVDPRPEQAARDVYGGDSYGFRRSVQADALVDGRRHPARVLSELESHVGPGALLDVGCATGELLVEARGRGWGVQGVEVSPYAAEVARARGVDVAVGLLRESSFPASAFDAVTMLDVIEHLHDPLAELRAIHRLLRPGGILCIETPNWRSVYRTLLGRRWAALQPRLHILYFDARSLSRLLNRAGFEVVESKTEIVSLLSPEAIARGLGPSLVRSLARDSLVRLLLRMPNPRLESALVRLGRATAARGDGSFRGMAGEVESAGAGPASAGVDGPGWRLLRALNRPLDRALAAQGRGEQLRTYARRL